MDKINILIDGVVMIGVYTHKVYSTPKETHHLYAFTVVKKFNWR